MNTLNRIRLIFQKILKLKIYQKFRQTKISLLFVKAIELSGFIQRDISFRYLRKIINAENPIIIEIGAEIGTDTVKFEKFLSSPTIFSFEPDPRNFKKLENKVKNYKNIIISNLAISDKKSSSDFFLSEDIYGDRDGQGSSSLKQPKNVGEIFSTILFDEKIRVDTISLDEWVEEKNIKKIDFIWADVQGAEDLIINGAQKTLNNLTRFFYTEFSNNELYESQPSLEQILSLLPDFEVKKLYTSNVLLKNKKVS